ncbi:hypothetical protein Z043_121922 [Scleropages formosus]|uniref:Uncharacterized protein n=1 Tax=Scleropages formosus TaxID=113540 RepID=A0A0P7Y360_SCLFO|nr:hypothetical protein Z043_121922 [Scleropages formosus]
MGDETYQDIFRDFSQMASSDPDRLNRFQPNDSHRTCVIKREYVAGLFKKSRVASTGFDIEGCTLKKYHRNHITLTEW